jgi:RNA polymerase sigma-70 factor (ECF subfamily)
MFMRAYQDMVFSTAARLTGNDAQAEDIAQEVFLRAYEHFSELRDNPSAGGWLKTVGINLTLNHLTRHRRRWRLFSELRRSGEDDDSGPDLDPAVPDTAVEETSAEERRALVESALQKLPDHQRLVLVLHHFEELSYQDIADKLGCSLTKVKTDIRRARAALLTVFRRSGTLCGPMGD